VKNSIAVHRVALLEPFVRFFEGIGSPVGSLLRRAKVANSVLDDLNNYIPSQLYWQFLVDSANSEGISDIGFRVGHQFGADAADPRMNELLQRSPTMYSGLLEAFRLVNRTVTHCRMGILQPPGREYAHFFHHPSCGIDNPALQQIGWFGITTLIGMVRAYAGPRWEPTEIGFMTDRDSEPFIKATYPRTTIVRSKRYCYVSVEKTLLNLPPIAFRAKTTDAATDYTAMPDSFARSLETILRPYVTNTKMSADFAAEISGLSKRTLQRRLMHEGTSYNQIINHLRFRTASKMLQDSEMQITEVALKLGYSDVGHFSRAFRKISGSSPLKLRKQKLS